MLGESPDFRGKLGLILFQKAGCIYLAIRCFILIELLEHFGPVEIRRLNGLLAAANGLDPDLVEGGFGFRMGRPQSPFGPHPLAWQKKEGFDGPILSIT